MSDVISIAIPPSIENTLELETVGSLSVLQTLLVAFQPIDAFQLY